MSPEQASLNNLDVDTRSDVYSLGVLLFELLTGTTPVDRKGLGKAALLEVLRIVREVEAPRPSTRLSSTDMPPSVAANRGTEPARLSRLLKGELAWVVMKALEKDRRRRYETANGLARDVQRYMADEVVEARPPSVGYRVGKFVRRHRGQVIAAILVLLALVGGVIGTTAGLFAARRQAEAARFNESAADWERKKAQRNLVFARKGNEILASVFAGLDPKQIAESGRPLQDVLRQNLSKAVKELEGSAIGDPLEVAAMQTTLGNSLRGLGEASLAVEVLQKALATFKARMGPNNPATLYSMNNLVMAYQDDGQLAKAVTLSEELLEKSKAKFGPDHPNTLASMSNLATAYHASGQLAKAVPLLKEALAKEKARLGPDHPNTLSTMNNLAMAYQDDGQLAKAVRLYQKTLEKAKAKLGPNHPNTLKTMKNLALAYHASGQLAKAVPLLEQSLQKHKAKLGAEHPQTLGTMAALGGALLQQKKWADAEPLLRDCLAAYEKQVPDRWLTFNTQSLLGGALLGQKRYAEAEPLLRKGYEGLKAREKTMPKSGGGELRIPDALDRLIELYTATTKPDEAKKWRAERAKYPRAKKPVAPEKK
jgi:tetratricopeptide (TPR) repeat protein